MLKRIFTLFPFIFATAFADQPPSIIHVFPQAIPVASLSQPPAQPTATFLPITAGYDRIGFIENNLPPNQQIGPHQHVNFVAIATILRGELSIESGPHLQTTHLAHAGDVFVIEPGVCHEYKNPGKMMTQFMVEYEMVDQSTNLIKRPCA